MSEAAKKRPTKKTITIAIGEKRPKLFAVPQNKAKSVEELLSDYRVELSTSIPADDAFKELDDKYSKAGNVLAGFRLRSKLTQTQLAKKIGTSQANIAAMENGKRKIGKVMAQKLANVFKTKYQLFLV